MADEGTGFEPITSQEQLDGIIKGRLARERERLSSKYADYDELKAKAAKFDEAEAAQMSDLEKARKEVEELKAAAEKRDEADRARDLRAKVSKATGVPADLISGSDEESMTAFAKAVAEFAKKPSAPVLKESGKSAGTKADNSAFREIARMLAGGKFDYQSNRHCAKTRAAPERPSRSFDYQSDRNCAKTRLSVLP